MSTRSGYRALNKFCSTALAAASVVVFVVTAGLPAAAAAQATVITDPVGDVAFKAPSYMDVVGATVTKTGRTLGFEMTVAAPVPAAPPVPEPANAQIGWAWPLDTDPSTFPAGPPLAPGTPGPAELVVGVVWDGARFSASLNDRRPLLSGGEAILTPLPFTISGGRLHVDVSASAIGNPSTFGWRPVTFYWSASFGSNNGNHFVDSTPSYIPFP